jgi:hypothetical protein
MNLKQNAKQQKETHTQILINQIMKANNKKKYDVVFNDSENSNSKGFYETIEFCQNWINTNKSNDTYFADYKGGSVSIVDTNSGFIIETIQL